MIVSSSGGFSGQSIVKYFMPKFSKEYGSGISVAFITWDILNCINKSRFVPARLSLMNNPSLILADEPTGNLDPANSVMIGDLLFSMAEKYNKTLILVTHDMKLAEKGDVRYSIKAGKLERVE